jgi:hypothetical protein
LRKEIAHTATWDSCGELKSEELLAERLLKEVPAPVRA